MTAHFKTTLKNIEIYTSLIPRIFNSLRRADIDKVFVIMKKNIKVSTYFNICIFTIIFIKSTTE